MTLGQVVRWSAALAISLMIASCSGRGASSARSGVALLRDAGQSTHNPELAGRWLLGELISPGGVASEAKLARRRLDQLGGTGELAELARGLDDAFHGKLKAAPDEFLKAVRAARVSDDPDAPFIAWFALHEAMDLRSNTPHLWKRWQGFVQSAMREPLHMGWRARGELVRWWAGEAYDRATHNVDELEAKQSGCVSGVRLAGPFGTGADADAYRHFAAEAPGPWPQRWPPAPGIGHAPHVLKTTRHGCFFSTDEPTSDGIYYAETYLDVPAARDVIIAVQGALAVWVDDEQVIDRDPRQWGVWPKFGASVWLTKGRHRVLARLADPSTSIRVMLPDGRPANLPSTTDAAAPYALVPPPITGDPNILDRYIKDGNVVPPHDDLIRFIAAYLAGVEGQGDVASVMIDPLVANRSQATGPALTTAASFVDKDPVYGTSQARDLVRDLHKRALAKDPGLWGPALSLALWKASRSGPAAAVNRVRALADRFPEVPDALMALAHLYAELGWSPEYVATTEKLLARFPENVDVLSNGVDLYDTLGEPDKADALVRRIEKIDPDNEIALTRALSRDDYKTALAELKRLGKRHPERKDIAERIYDVLVRSGDQAETWKKLEAAIKKEPRSGADRLALADAKYAAGDHAALRKALVDAVVNGANPEPLKNAIDLVEGMSELAPYRIKALPVIRAYEKSGRRMPGTAARILDYAAVWVHADGSSSLLEHEIIRIQSAEAITRLAEENRPSGLVLHMRVIKKDGRILEPEPVAGKPTVTFPDLQVGDYIETEHITTMRGDGQTGLEYLSPHWFFREENIAYARSEFIVITPEGKKLIIETHGKVPPPKVTKKDGIVVHRWRVDYSPAAPAEPNSAPITEFLPSVQVGWGINLKQRLRALSNSVAETTPVDPRIARIAHSITAHVPATAKTEQATLLYRWVLANVEQGSETDGRRVIMGRHGNRWRGFIALCRALGIHVRYAIAKNRLASPAIGPISQAAEFTDPLLYLKSDRGPIWLTVSSKYAPFGYVPAELRGVPAYLLGHRTLKRVMTPAGGGQDSVVYDGDATLSADGSARIQLSESFYGKYAMALRGAFAQLPEAQMHDVLESRLLGRALRGARLVSYHIDHADDLDAPLSIRMTATMSGFAQPSGHTLILSPPFAPSIGRLAALPTRQTPLLIGQATHQEVHLRITLPPGARVLSTLTPGVIRDADRSVSVQDRIAGNRLILNRVIDIPAGRIQPKAYPSFVQFARRADDALSSNIVVRVGR